MILPGPSALRQSQGAIPSRPSPPSRHGGRTPRNCYAHCTDEPRRRDVDYELPAPVPPHPALSLGERENRRQSQSQPVIPAVGGYTVRGRGCFCGTVDGFPRAVLSLPGLFSAAPPGLESKSNNGASRQRPTGSGRVRLSQPLHQICGAKTILGRRGSNRPTDGPKTCEKGRK